MAISQQPLINTDACNRLFKTELNKSIHDAAEPIIQKALQDIERKMRERVGQFVISYIDRTMHLERFGEDLRIIIKQG